MFWKKSKNRKSFKCSKCGEVHDQLPALAFLTPDYYGYLNDEDKKNIAEISDDFCVIKHPEQTDRFIRTTMTLQIIDACEDLDYGIWVSVSEKTFDEYKTDFKNNIEGKTYFGRICNEIPEYRESTLGLHVNVVTKSNGIRPEIIPHESGHELIKDWEKGITISEAERRVQNMMNNVG
ncbi:MAG: DUF2199 domain-containing protein [Chitinophagales bacterium]|nr:DUF2199 domain-containing protein [Chitinophagales bacterium]